MRTWKARWTHGMVFILGMAMLLIQLSVPVSAGEPENAVTVGPFHIIGGVEGTDYEYSEEDKVLYIKTDTPLTVSTTENTDSRIEAQAPSANLTLAGVDITLSSKIARAIWGHMLTLTLAEDTTNTIINSENVAIGTSDNLTLTGSGTLIANGRYSGIVCGGILTIEDGVISVAAANEPEASSCNGINSYKISVSGGIVTAYGGGCIYGSSNGISANTMEISGGIVTACGGSDSRVSYGISCERGTLKISGGKVTAGHVGNGAGIGGGEYGPAGLTTGTSGTAVILTTSLDVTGDRDTWRGIIFDGNDGWVNGSQTLTGDFSIDSGKTLTIRDGAVLTIKNGVTLDNEGTIINNGKIVNNGVMNNNGVCDNNNGIIEGVLPTGNKILNTVGVTGGSGSGTYEAGQTVTITAKAPEAGKQFKEWSGADGLSFIEGTDKTSAIAKFTMPARTVNVTAVYEDIPDDTDTDDGTDTDMGDGNTGGNTPTESPKTGDDVSLMQTAVLLGILLGGTFLAWIWRKKIRICR